MTNKDQSVHSYGQDNKPPLARSLQQFRNSFVCVGAFSALINLLALTGSLFMLQVYDRVLPSKSVPTLIGLAFIVLGLYAFQAVLDLVRTRVMVRIGSGFDASMTERIYHSVLKLPLKAPRGPEGLQPIRDLDVIRAFLGGPGLLALFDLPWIPIYLGLCFAFHFYIGLTATIGALVVIALTLLTEVLSRTPIRDASKLGSERSSFAELSRRNSETFHALGMTGRMGARWRATNAAYSDAQERLSDVTGGLGSIAKVSRMVLQSAVLGVGAYLVIEQQATAGIIIASSILHGPRACSRRRCHRKLEGVRRCTPRMASPDGTPDLPAGRCGSNAVAGAGVGPVGR